MKPKPGRLPALYDQRVTCAWCGAELYHHAFTGEFHEAAAPFPNCNRPVHECPVARAEIERKEAEDRDAGTGSHVRFEFPGGRKIGWHGNGNDDIHR